MTRELKAPVFDGLYFPPGEVIAERFKLAEKIGEGPFGQVYRAQDLLVDVDVAIKVLEKGILRSPLEEESFLKSTRRARALTQKNVARLHDSGIHKDYPWVSMQYLEGLHLRKVVQLRHDRREDFRVEELEPIITQITLALQHVARDSAHCNLKPENIIFLPDLLKITDSHLRSSIPSDAFARRNQSSFFVAPELLSDDGEGIEDSRCDVYSVGAIIAYMLFGDDYTPGDGANESGKRSAMDALCCRAMAFDPMERYPSVESLNEDFTSIIDTGTMMDTSIVTSGKGTWASPSPLPPSQDPPSPPSPPPLPSALALDELSNSVDAAALGGPTKEAALFDEETPLDIGTAPAEVESTREFNREDYRNDLGNLLPTNEVDRSEFPEPQDQPIPGTGKADEKTTDGGPVALPKPPATASKVPSGASPRTTKSSTRGGFIILGVLALVILLAVVFGGDSATEQEEESQSLAHVKDSDEGVGSEEDGLSEVEEFTESENADLLASLEAAQPHIAAAVMRADRVAKERAEALTREQEASTEAEEVSQAGAATVADSGASASTERNTTSSQTGGQGASTRPDQGASAPQPAPARGTSCPPGMVLVRRGDGNICIDAYEYPGRGQTPRTRVSWFDARRTCDDQGKRLCELSEWRSACGRSFPYGNRFDADTCNTADEDGFARSIAAAGSFSGCRSSSGTFDMSGNVHEWVAGQQVAGGSFDSEADLASCRYSSAKAPGSADANVGFRCCADPQ